MQCSVICQPFWGETLWQHAACEGSSHRRLVSQAYIFVICTVAKLNHNTTERASPVATPAFIERAAANITHIEARQSHQPASQSWQEDYSGEDHI